MAIYYFRLKQGKNYKHLEYINRDNKYNFDVDGKLKNDLVDAKAFNIPKGIDNIYDFWKSAILYERKNATIYKEFEISLPQEFNDKKNKEILEKFLNKTFGKNFVYNYAIHNKNNINPHAHVMFCERKLDGVERDIEMFFKRYNDKNPKIGGAKKDREIASRPNMRKNRKNWEEHLNKYLRAAGIEEVSCESLKKQREKAIKDGNILKAELLNRNPVDVKKDFKYIKNKQDNYEEEMKKYNEEKNIRNETEDFLERKKVLEKIKKLRKKSFKEILVEKEKIETEIFKLNNKLDDTKIKNMCEDILSDGKINNIKNNKRKLFKELKNTQDKNLKNEIKKKIKLSDEEIENLISKIDKDKLEDLILDKKAKYAFVMKKLYENKKTIDYVFLEKLNKLNLSDEDKLLYVAYTDRQKIEKERQTIRENLFKNKQKIKNDLKNKNYINLKNLKVDNFNLIKKDFQIEKALKNLKRSLEADKKISGSEFHLDDIEKYFEKLEKENMEMELE